MTMQDDENMPIDANDCYGDVKRRGWLQLALALDKISNKPHVQ